MLISISIFPLHTITEAVVADAIITFVQIYCLKKHMEIYKNDKMSSFNKINDKMRAILKYSPPITFINKNQL